MKNTGLILISSYDRAGAAFVAVVSQTTGYVVAFDGGYAVETMPDIRNTLFPLFGNV